MCAHFRVVPASLCIIVLPWHFFPGSRFLFCCNKQLVIDNKQWVVLLSHQWKSVKGVLLTTAGQILFTPEGAGTQIGALFALHLSVPTSGAILALQVLWPVMASNYSLSSRSSYLRRLAAYPPPPSVCESRQKPVTTNSCSAKSCCCFAATLQLSFSNLNIV